MEAASSYNTLRSFMNHANNLEPSDQNREHYSENLPYFKHSHICSIHNQFQAEIIFRPYKRLILQDDFIRLKEDLWHLLMHSCYKGEQDEMEYRKHIDIEKVGIDVDYLIIIRTDSKPAAFISGTYINRGLFYINCAMILPEFQLSGLGSILTAMLCRNALVDSGRLFGQSPSMICRTQNQEVASALLRSMKTGIISTEQGLTSERKKQLSETAEFLHCQLDANGGITKNAYPEGLPKGKRIKNQRVINAFASLGERDACYVLGEVNEWLVNAVIKRYIRSYKEICNNRMYNTTH